ncbi:MAG TPA: hypothetical protein DEQ09_12350 [Bacteroidales bacterium]|nr:hypothetical protein [Bacteroidales bacterium]
MGVKSAGDTKPEQIFLISSLKNRLTVGSATWFVILLLLVASVITVLFKLWLISILLMVINLLVIIWKWLSIKNSINNTRAEIDDLHQLIEKKESYISDFSHRIRTPLNNIPLINDLLGELNVSGKQKELLDTLISSTNNMISALNELTMRSAGEISIEPRKNIRFDLRKTIDNTFEILDIEAAGNIILDISWDERVKKEYIGDPIAIKQIFIDIYNLWSSIPESSQPDISIYIKIKSPGEKTDTLEFIIETEALPAEAYNDISEEKIIKRLSGKIINLMEGQYSYETKDNKAVFTFTLPFNNVSEKEIVNAIGQKIRKLDTVIRQKKELSDANILLVEDNITNQKIVKISLGTKVKSIDTALNGKEALDMFGKSNYDIILMDIQLPVIDGITVSRKIREIESSTSKHTPIIAITANAMIGDKEKCLSAGIDDYLSKPFQPQKLLDLIDKYIKGLETV